MTTTIILGHKNPEIRSSSLTCDSIYKMIFDESPFHIDKRYDYLRRIWRILNGLIPFLIFNGKIRLY